MKKSGRMSVTLSEEVIKALDEKAFEWNCSRSEAMRQVLESALGFQVPARINANADSRTFHDGFDANVMKERTQEQLARFRSQEDDGLIGKHEIPK
ncbi:CopG family transcriptional regulator [Tateyamaria sp. syn59]|uniref:ribbon-helix-helix domain-containing protein n=1 Tax=Tateyamaria sp. syn59 TaxID=2576942 RepID=UPI0011BDF3D7|nr:CopG family transcriptional regulator [Tateyamaria sp. syn59]